MSGRNGVEIRVLPQLVQGGPERGVVRAQENCGVAQIHVEGDILYLFARLARMGYCRHMHVAVLFELRSEEHTSELPSLMRISYAVFCLKKKNNTLQE